MSSVDLSGLFQAVDQLLANCGAPQHLREGLGHLQAGDGISTDEHLPALDLQACQRVIENVAAVTTSGLQASAHQPVTEVLQQLTNAFTTGASRHDFFSMLVLVCHSWD